MNDHDESSKTYPFFLDHIRDLLNSGVYIITRKIKKYSKRCNRPAPSMKDKVPDETKRKNTNDGTYLRVLNFAYRPEKSRSDFKSTTENLYQ